MTAEQQLHIAAPLGHQAERGPLARAARPRNLQRHAGQRCGQAIGLQCSTTHMAATAWLHALPDEGTRHALFQYRCVRAPVHAPTAMGMANS